MIMKTLLNLIILYYFSNNINSENDSMCGKRSHFPLNYIILLERQHKRILTLETPVFSYDNKTQNYPPKTPNYPC